MKKRYLLAVVVLMFGCKSASAHNSGVVIKDNTIVGMTTCNQRLINWNYNCSVDTVQKKCSSKQPCMVDRWKQCDKEYTQYKKECK